MAVATEAVVEQSDTSTPGAPLLPSVEDVRMVSAGAGVAVALAADKEDLAQIALDDPPQKIYQTMWQPVIRESSRSDASSTPGSTPQPRRRPPCQIQ
jgi:malate dehydrogenase (oxaloacetate-decarboxylating)